MCGSVCRRFRDLSIDIPGSWTNPTARHHGHFQITQTADGVSVDKGEWVFQLTWLNNAHFTVTATGSPDWCVDENGDYINATEAPLPLLLNVPAK